MTSSSYFSFFQVMSAGMYLILLGIMVTIAIFRFRQRATGRWLMIIGAISAPIFGVASYIVNYGLMPVDDETMMKVRFATIIAASFSQILFLIGVLLHALRGSSESARITELEAIIRERDR